MTRDFNNMSKWSSRGMTRIELDNLRAKSSSMPTRTSVCRWVWLLPIITKMFGRLFSNVIRIEMAESVVRR